MAALSDGAGSAADERNRGAAVRNVPAAERPPPDRIDLAETEPENAHEMDFHGGMCGRNGAGIGLRRGREGLH